MARIHPYTPAHCSGYSMNCDVCTVSLVQWFFKCLNCRFNVCNECWIEFKYRMIHCGYHAMQRVILKHNIEQLYNCPWCFFGEKFVGTQNLYDHLEVAHPHNLTIDCKVYCPACMVKYRFIRTSNILEHLRVNHDCFTKPTPPPSCAEKEN